MKNNPGSLVFIGICAGLTAMALSSCSKSPSGEVTPLPSTNQTAETAAPATATATAFTRQETLLDADWQFHLGDVTSSDEVIVPGYDDSQWQRINVPHDYVLSGPYADSKDKQVRSHAYLTYKPAWYRKHLAIPASDRRQSPAPRF